MREYSITIKVDEQKQTATILYREDDKLVGRIAVEPPEKGAQAFKVIGAGGTRDMVYSPSLKSAIRLAIRTVADDIVDD